MRWLIILLGFVLLFSCTERPEITTLECIHHPGEPGYWTGGGGGDEGPQDPIYIPPTAPWNEVNLYVSDDCWFDLYFKDIDLNVVWKSREHTHDKEWHSGCPGNLGTKFVTVTLDGGDTETVEVTSY